VADELDRAKNEVDRLPLEERHHNDRGPDRWLTLEQYEARVKA
jgi:hypothetical protein